MPVCRGIPSISMAISMMCRSMSSLAYKSFSSCIDTSSPSFIGLPSRLSMCRLPIIAGNSLVILFTSENGWLYTRATSLIAALAAMVPKVTICETLSLPYFSVTYWMTSSRRSTQKSMSKSGLDTRSGFKNRSKMSEYCSGSTLVMPMAYATDGADAAAPVPGSYRRPCASDQWMKSHTMRK